MAPHTSRPSWAAEKPPRESEAAHVKAGIPRAKGDEFVKKLVSLARVNAFEFQRSPALGKKFLKDLSRGRFRYVDDALTCGRADCWSSYRALSERYGKGNTVLFDCEDGAAALSGYLASQCYGGVYIGLVPPPAGPRIPGRPLVSHAVSGIRQGDAIQILDPSRWYGMGPFGRPYEPVWWGEVKCDSCPAQKPFEAAPGPLQTILQY